MIYNVLLNTTKLNSLLYTDDLITLKYLQFSPTISKTKINGVQQNQKENIF